MQILYEGGQNRMPDTNGDTYRYKQGYVQIQTGKRACTNEDCIYATILSDTNRAMCRCKQEYLLDTDQKGVKGHTKILRDT